MSSRVAVDIGGTFTDLVCLDEDGEVRVAKASTTPGRFEDGVMDVLGEAGVDGVEDVFTYLGLGRFYIRFPNAWVFGEFGNSARHGDLGEDDHRRWVLPAVLGVAGWLEYLGGEQDYVALLVERLELEPGDEAADAT